MEQIQIAQFEKGTMIEVSFANVTQCDTGVQAGSYNSKHRNPVIG